ncbi:2-dehydro-3-deoxygalactonokinase [Octadecabacter sp. 1_MG-2023]|uniref:2-dehydro-3-deoxygalactonokinase n=1 Tax=unclassified Octadecabacter TaxID=196158 RepID=UPI001C09C28E|nr:MULTISPECIES: 2-dehydro-3-deoxygalactonokinase [unclassified Octadecabacter]MBU2994619.1 2-dehydro-3-deoxygalactonokinase [Octadecabacter sp. B2R22]MDO6734088.1 2-dehydro-3-deoxygalactonokinase [Octadecabacter sp. 1_MG-2023]
MTETATWIAVDWGTSNLRAWVFGAGDALIAQLGSDQGMGSLTPDQFEPALLDLIAPYLGDNPTPVICCGMVGARQGWQEAAYVSVPAVPPSVAEATIVTPNDPRIAPVILPGMMQSNPADVMRGEETQIAGFLSQRPDFDGVLCLPGTHTKWVHISAGEVVSFSTYMSGEMFGLLSEQSVLRHSAQSDGWDNDSFLTAVDDTLSRPQNLAARLFGLRAETLLNDMTSTTAKSSLSGLLIGLELAGAKPYWLGREIALIGDPTLAQLYKTALDQQGAPSEIYTGDDMTLLGLKAAYASWKDS